MMTKSMKTTMNAVCVVGMLVSAGTAMAQQAWGPSPQTMYQQHYGSAPTFVSYGAPKPAANMSARTLSVRPAVKAAPAARMQTRATASVSRPKVRAVAAYGRQSSSGF